MKYGFNEGDRSAFLLMCLKIFQRYSIYLGKVVLLLARFGSRRLLTSIREQQGNSLDPLLHVFSLVILQFIDSVHLHDLVQLNHCGKGGI